jgi:hypothetical protein
VGTTKADIERACQRRQRVIDYLAGVLTDPACPLEVNDLCHFRLVGTWFGGSEAIKRLSATHDEKPQLRDEILISVVVEALDRLLA